MDDIIRIDKVTYDDFTKVKFAPVSREEILENITKTLLWIADKCKKLELDLSPTPARLDF